MKNDIQKEISACSTPISGVEYSELSSDEQEKILLLQQAILESVALGGDHMKMINSVCELEEKLLPNSVGSVMLLDATEHHLNVYAAPSIPPDGVAQLNGLVPGPHAGSCGNVIYRQEPVYVADTLTDSRWNNLRQLAINFGLMACWSMPIRSVGGKVIGTFALSSFEHRSPSPFHRKLLEIGAFMIGILLEQKKAQTRIEFLAYHDSLTGLPNYQLLRDRLELAMPYAERSYAKIALLYLDLDNFKMINDSLGHSVGDELIKGVAERLQDCVQVADTISRRGGDEFLIMLANVHDGDDIASAASKILDVLSSDFTIDQHELVTSLSIGIAVYPDDGADFDSLLQKANTAVFQAKEAGRNTYRFYNDKMNVDAIEHLTMRSSLGRAVERDEFVLYYQPQFDLKSGKLVGAEALIRWNHPEHGLVPPGRFIPIAEDSGLIVRIGEWVLNEACRQAMAWQQEGLPKIVVAVNLSALQFRRGNLGKTVTSALAQSALAPRYLELEITESLLIQDADSTFAVVNHLKSLGVQFSIDDFGTGYSSLSYLKRLHVDKLKIDQSFIRNLANDPEDAAIVFAIVQMAHNLKMKTIAEGVEEAGLIEKLKRYKCDEVQGYHFSRPLPAIDFARYLREHVKQNEMV